MSYGSYDNSSPLSQPFNPTGPSAGQDIVDTAARSAVGAVGQQFQGNNGKSSGQFGNGIGIGKSQPGGQRMMMPGGQQMMMPGGNLPGSPPQSAQPPLTPQENVEQSRRSGGILKIRGQQPSQPAQMPGGKGGKSGPDVNDRITNPMPGIFQPGNMDGVAYDSNIDSDYQGPASSAVA